MPLRNGHTGDEDLGADIRRLCDEGGLMTALQHHRGEHPTSLAQLELQAFLAQQSADEANVKRLRQIHWAIDQVRDQLHSVTPELVERVLRQLEARIKKLESGA